VMTVFTHIYPLAPAPLIFLSLGSVLLGSSILPRVFAYLAIGLGVAFEVVGLISLFTAPMLAILVLAFQSLWVLAAAIIFLVRALRMPTSALGMPSAAGTARLSQ